MQIVIRSYDDDGHDDDGDSDDDDDDNGDMMTLMACVDHTTPLLLTVQYAVYTICSQYLWVAVVNNNIDLIRCCFSLKHTCMHDVDNHDNDR